MNKRTENAPKKSACKEMIAGYADELEFIDHHYNPQQPDSLVDAISVVARVRGMTKIARASGISRDGLYKAFSVRGNPSLNTVMKVLWCLGYKLKVTPKD